VKWLVRLEHHRLEPLEPLRQVPELARGIDPVANGVPHGL
jgi:hypothetical protein